jgi:hypothetical protein
VRQAPFALLARVTTMLRLLLATCLLVAFTAPVLAWSEPECVRLERSEPLCAVMEWYNLHGQSGTLKVILADGEAYLLLQHEVWRMAGDGVALQARVDDEPPVWREAKAREDGLLIPLPLGDLDALARGRSLTLVLPQIEFTFPLTGSLEALNALMIRYAEFATGSAGDSQAGERRE